MSDVRWALGTFRLDDGRPFAALVLGDQAIAFEDLPERPAATTVLEALEDWEASFAVLDRAAGILRGEREPPHARPVETLHALPPVNLPRQVFGIGANYRKFAVSLAVRELRGAGREGSDAELAAAAERVVEDRAASGEFTWFTKLVSSVAGAADPLVLASAQVQWECELGVVIGKPAHHVRAADAHRHVAGYTVVNDLMDMAAFAPAGPRSGPDWIGGKSQPGFTPIGPWFVPAAFVADPYALRLRTTLNGAVMQDDLASDMLVRIDRQIEYLSQRCRLMPGDVICTGTPIGNGLHHGRFLAPGDHMLLSIEGLGSQSTRCLAADSHSQDTQ